MNGTLVQDLAPGVLQDACRALLAEGGRIQMAYAWFPDPDGGPELRYLASTGARRPFALWRVRLANGEAVPSLAGVSPLLGWYEREMTDLAGVRFAGHPEPYRLVLHEGAEPEAPPLRPSRAPQRTLVAQPAERWIPPVDSSQVQLLPFGPVRADVFESGQFLFHYIGERILHYQPRLFFKHRGMEKRFESVAPALGVILAERVSGVGSVAHALAFAQAVEAAAGCELPRRARWLRVIAAELERVYNHLHYLGHLCHTTTLKVGEAEGKLLEERAKQLNARVSGSRFLRGVVGLGGVRRDLSLEGAAEALSALRAELERYEALLERTHSHLDRLITTGPLPRQTAFDQGATGPVERASGLDRDLRRDHPYAAYDELLPVVPLRQEGDAYARARVRIGELHASLGLLAHALRELPAGPLAVRVEPAAGSEGLGWAETPRGSLYYAVHLDERGRLARVKIKSPSFSNWRVFPHTMHDTNMMDYLINEASFGSTIAGCDR